ncbi:MAG: hypothetical protein NVS3B10_08220 [Polyangiales bacterium]
MTIAGDHPERGVRIALDLHGTDEARARYVGHAFTPAARHPVDLAVEVATGVATVHVGLPIPAGTPLDDAPPSSLGPPASLESSELAFIRQLGKQLWRLATQTAPEHGGGQWPRRVQRWRGPRT